MTRKSIPKRNESIPKPPGHLSNESARWWSDIISRFEIEPHQLPTLTHCAECLDEAEVARRILDKEGLFAIGKRGRKILRPEYGIHLKSTKTFMVLLTGLNLDAAPSEPPRPPRLRYR